MTVRADVEFQMRRWIYGVTEKEAFASAQALALRILADRIEQQKRLACALHRVRAKFGYVTEAASNGD